jgi:hypothetical protein
MSALEIGVLILAAVGIGLAIWSGARLGKSRHLADSVLAPGRYSKSEEHEIRQSVHRGELPGRKDLHAAAIMWAREETTYGPFTRVWMFWQPIGIALAASALYLLPGVVAHVIVAVVQVVIILGGLGGVSYSRRGDEPAKELLRNNPGLVNHPGTKTSP